MECDTAGDAEEALQHIAGSTRDGQRPYDMLLSDAEMPDLNGFELAEKVKRETAAGDLPVVLMGIGTDDDLRRCTKAKSVAGCLARPFRAAQLRSEVQRVLRGVRPDPPRGQETGYEPGPRTGAASPLGFSILLAEDNEANVVVASAMLEEMGCVVECARNGHEVVALYESGDFDAILMDCQMPHLDGYEATRRIRRLESSNGGPETPILALTAHAVSGDRERCLTSGMNAYLTKPITMEKLREALEEWCGKTSMDASADGSAKDIEFDPAPLEKLGTLRQADERGVVRRVIDAYLGSCPDLLQRARAAVSDGNDVELREAAHALKSSSLNVGAVGLASLCSELEQRAGREDDADAAQLVPQIESAFAAVRRTLNTMKAEAR